MIAGRAVRARPVPAVRWTQDPAAVAHARAAWRARPSEATGNGLLHACYGVTFERTLEWDDNAAYMHLRGCNKTHVVR